MKKRDLERALENLGWYFLKHDRWTNGKETEEIPRHKKVAEMLAKKILKTAKHYPGIIK